MNTERCAAIQKSFQFSMYVKKPLPKRSTTTRKNLKKSLEAENNTERCSDIIFQPTSVWLISPMSLITRKFDFLLELIRIVRES